MRIQSGAGGAILRDSSAILIATALIGLTATSAVGPALAHEVDDRGQARVGHAAFSGHHPAVWAVTPGFVVSRAVRDPAPLEAEIRMLLCLEAREAIQTGQLSQQLLDWILSDAHRCMDDQLLVDTFGF